MNAHKIKRKPVNAPQADSQAGYDEARHQFPQRTPRSRDPLARNVNAHNVDSTPPFPIMRRGDVMNGTSSSPSKLAGGPSGPRARQAPAPAPTPSRTPPDDAQGPSLPSISARTNDERAIAFPSPSGPKAPIRNSATTGLTSVHLGVRPRVVGKDTVGPTTVRMQKSDSETEMSNGYERVPAVPGKTWRAGHDKEDVPGIGVGYGRRKKVLSDKEYDDQDDNDDKQTDFTSSSATSASGARHPREQTYKLKPATPTISVEDQAAKYDAEYRARLKRAERGRPRNDDRKRAEADALDDEAYWQETMLNDDPRIEGIYTFDYSPNPSGGKGKTQPRARARGEEPSRITEYEDPSRPGIVMKSRKYLPVPVDERSYGVPAGRRARAFVREREEAEGRPPVAAGKVRVAPGPAVRKEVSTYSAFSTSSDEKRSRTPPQDRRRRTLVEERGSTTPKASQAVLAAERPGPGQVRSNPNMKQDRTGRQLQYRSTDEEYEEDEERFRQKVRKLRSEPALQSETRPRARREPSAYTEYDDNNPVVWQRGVEAAASLDDASVPPMPDGEEYDEQTERERQEAWRQYYAAMQMYATTPMMSPGVAMGYVPNGAEHQMMPGMMGNRMMNAGAGMNGHPESFSRMEEDAMARAKKAERRHRRREAKSEGPSPVPPPKARRDKTSSALALTGLVTPGDQGLPTPHYGGHQPEGYFPYDPYLAGPTMPQRSHVPPGSNGYNAANDPFAMHAVSAALNGVGGGGYGMAPPATRNKRSWYGGMMR